MFVIFENNNTVRLYMFGLIYAATLMGYSTDAKYEYDDCKMKDNTPGICVLFRKCQTLIDEIRSGAITIYDPVRCGFKLREEIICCPTKHESFQPSYGFLAILRPYTTRSKTIITKYTIAKQAKRVNERHKIRPAEEACRIIMMNLRPIFKPQILSGKKVQAGDYPHMAAIGYITIGEEWGPIEFRCSGTLIHERFILTAAHCVTSRDFKPAIVRLGMSNFDDDDELDNRLEVPIKTLHIHPNYSTLKKINDVALLELEKPVKRTRYISPTCLYTENADPPAEAELYVSGWGVSNYTTKRKSNALLKARMQIVSNSICKEAYKYQIYTIEDKNMCAADPQKTSDACQGDSGGPLLLHVDESTLNYRQVGIIASGSSCGNGYLPGLYMRVSSYLDYIESIVWPSS